MEVNKQQANKSDHKTDKAKAFLTICLHDVFEVLGVVMAFIGLVIVLGVMAMHQRSVSLDFLKPSLEKLINTEGLNVTIAAKHYDLAWPGPSYPIVLQARDVNITKFLTFNNCLCRPRSSIYIIGCAIARKKIHWNH